MDISLANEIQHKQVSGDQNFRRAVLDQTSGHVIQHPVPLSGQPVSLQLPGLGLETLQSHTMHLPLQQPAPPLTP